MAIALVPLGPHSCESTTPEWIPTVGTPRPAAMCFGPLSLPTKSAQRAMSAGKSPSPTRPISDQADFGLARASIIFAPSSTSSAPPTRITWTSSVSMS